MKRVRWSIDELSKVLEVASKDITHPSNFTVKDIKRVQVVLAPERRRKTFNPTFIREFQQQATKMANVRLGVYLEPPAPKEEPKPEKNQLEQAIEQISSLVEKIIAPIIEKTVVKRLAELSESIKALAKPAYQKFEEHTKNLESLKKSKVLIVGLREDQQARIVKEFDDIFQLLFYKDKGSHRDLRTRALNSDKVFLMTKFINHSQQTNVLAVARGKTTFVNGCESELCESLTSYFVEEK